MTIPPTLHPLSELCETLRLTEQTMRRFLRSIGFRAIQGGDTLLFTDEDIIVIIEARRMTRRRRRSEQQPRRAVEAPLSDYEIEKRLAALRLNRRRTKHIPAASNGMGIQEPRPGDPDRKSKK